MAQLRRGPEIEAFLRRPDPRMPVVLVYGPDAGLANERARHLARASVEDPDDPFQLIRFDGDEIAGDAMRLADEANTIGLFGGRRCIWVRAGSRNLVPLLEPLLAAPPRDATVVVEAGDLGPKAPLRTVVEKAASAIALPCYLDDARDLPSLIEQELKAHGLGITRDARDAMAAQLGSDRLLSRREIEKVALFAHGEAAVEIGHVEAVMADASAMALDQVTDAVFSGDASALDHGLGRLFAEGEDPGMVAGAALRQALNLHKARLSADRGVPAQELARAARVFGPRRTAAFERHLRLWTAPALESALATLREAQLAIRRQPRLGPALASRALLTIALAARRER
jgi:DNA polymerase-3 subunit delta